MKYTRNDLENIIAICEQEDSGYIAHHLSERCKKALAYRDVSIRLTHQDKEYLRKMYDENMDEDAKETIKRVALTD